MFSLKPKKNDKPKPAESNKETCPGKSKGQSKKIAKTVFEDPFHYRIQLLPQEEALQAQALLLSYLQKLRQSIPFKQARVGLKKTIKFETDKNIKEKLSPIVSSQIAIGIKATKMALYSNHKEEGKGHRVPHLTLIFYDEKKYEQLMELLCLLKVLNSPYLLMRESGEVSRALGVRTVGSLCLFEQQFANSLLKYIGKCLIEIPWLIDISAATGPQSSQQN